MNDTHHNAQHDGELRVALEGLNRDGLRMAASDGEAGAHDLLASAGGTIGGVSESDAAAMHNEAALRHAVARAMHTTTPAGLRERVLGAMAAADTDGPSHADASEPHHVHSSAHAPGRNTGTRQHGHRADRAGASGVLARIGRPLAAAAVLALGGLAVFQAVNTANPGGGQSASIIPINQLQELSQYLTGRHAGASLGDIEGQAMDAAAALQRVEAAVGDVTASMSVGITRLADSGYTIRVMKVCEVPNAVRSAHLQLTPPADAANTEPVSLFVQTGADNAKACLLAKMKRGDCYSCPDAEAAGDAFMFWRDGPFVLHAVGASTQGVEQLIRVLDAPSSRVPLR